MSDTLSTFTALDLRLRPKKGQLIFEHFRLQGVTVHLPTLNIPSFEKLSPNLIIEEIRKLLTTISGSDVRLVGSSFGGFLALRALNGLTKLSVAPVSSLVLLAPALYPWDEESGLVSAVVEQQWRKERSFPLFYYERNQTVHVHLDFLEELRALTPISTKYAGPTLLIHGKQDTVVPALQSVRYVSENPHARLVLVDDDHELLLQPAALLEYMDDFYEEVLQT